MRGICRAAALSFPRTRGMDLEPLDARVGVVGFPRTRGDGPQCPKMDYRNTRFPPHTRGWTGDEAADREDGRVSPAHAGMDRGLKTHRRERMGFPRTRGDGPQQMAGSIARNQFPPHTRGWTPDLPDPPADRPVSPAHAGMDREGLR